MNQMSSTTSAFVSVALVWASILLTWGTECSAIPEEEQAAPSGNSSEVRTGSWQNFPGSTMSPESLERLIDGVKLESTVDAVMIGEDGSHIPMIWKVFQIEVPGFEGKQRVSVLYTQDGRTPHAFIGPGFRYQRKGDELVLKAFARLLPQDWDVFEGAFRYMIAEERLEGRVVCLRISKDSFEFPINDAFLDRFDDLKLTFRSPHELRKGGRQLSVRIAEWINETEVAVRLGGLGGGHVDVVCRFHRVDGKWRFKEGSVTTRII